MLLLEVIGALSLPMAAGAPGLLPKSYGSTSLITSGLPTEGVRSTGSVLEVI